MKTPLLRTLRGLVVGAVLGGLVQSFSAVVAYLSTSQDRASKKAASVVEQALGNERYWFLLRLIAMVMIATALCGAAQALVRVLLRRKDEAKAPGWLRDLGWTFALISCVVLGRASAAPALLVPAIPLPSGLASWLASHVSPAIFYALPIFVLAFALGRWLRYRRLAAVAVVALPLLSCSHGRLRPAAGGKPNVLILAADSVRPDHMSAFGYQRPTTPNLDKLVAQGAVFERTMAPLAMTTPSWTSILTGRYPHHHGIRHMFPDRRVRPRSLDTIPKNALEAGYRTTVLSDYAGDFFPIFDFGFEETRTSPPLNTRTLFQREVVLRSPLALAFLEPLPDAYRPTIFRYLMNAADADRLADEIIANFDVPSDKPFFTVAFFSTTHVPFAPRYPFVTKFTRPDYAGEHKFAYNLSSIADIARAENPVTADDAHQLVGLYDGALASVDAACGRVLDGLTARGLDDDTIVVFLSDHGENLFEPGQTTLHGKWFRGGDEANRVPFIVRGKNVKPGTKVDQVVSLVDVAPTLAEMLQLRPLERADGRSLVTALKGDALAPRTVFAETGAWLNGAPDPESIATPPLAELIEADPDDDGQLVLRTKYEDLVVIAKHRALWDGRLKLIYEPTPAGAHFSLFDLASDPRQEHDLVTDPRAAPLITSMWRWLGRDPEREVDARGHTVRRAD